MMERSSMQGGRCTYGTRWGALCGALILFLGFGLMSIPATARAAKTTVLTVTNLTDSASNPAAGSLRAAINTANGKGGTSYKIVFASGLSGTITLKSTLDIDAGAIVTIDGGGSIAISGDNSYQVMSVASGATLELDNITIENGEENNGGGVDNSGTLTVTDSTFSGNIANSGGGIYNGGSGKLMVTNSTFSGNTVPSSDAITYGGGIENLGEATVSNSTFSNNAATNGFGGGIDNQGTLRVTNSTFSGNRTLDSDSGGGIENDGSGKLMVTNSTFSRNVAYEFGGGICNIGQATVSNSTFSDNTAYDRSGPFGGGIYSGESGTVSLKGTILDDPGFGGDCHNYNGSITDGGYNISIDNSCGFSSSKHSYSDYTTSLFSGGLANNGGPTETIALAPGTAAIDAIPAADCTDAAGNPLTTDQRGYTRPDEGESVCDIGAYESGATVTGAKLQIDTSTGSFDLNTPIIFVGAIDPVTQNVTLQIGTYSITIPAGSFVQTKKGDYVFQGTIGDVSLQVRLVPQSDGSYTLQLQGSGAPLSGSTNPVTVAVTLTDANGNVVATSGISATASIN